MKKRKSSDRAFAGYCTWWFIGLLALGGAAVGQKEDPIIIQEEPKEKKDITASTPIGLEAVREVIDSGRYLVGPGDEFLIFIAGGAKGAEHIKAKVLAQGGLLIPGMGLVKVGGLRLKEAIARIHQKYDDRVRHGQLSVELSQVRTFPVTIVGRVLDPGVYEATAVERVGEILRRHELLSGASSRRNIRVYKTASRLVRDTVGVAETAQQDPFDDWAELEFNPVDLMLYKVTGLSRYNPFVEDGDIIRILPEEGEIAVSGAVNRAGFYEFVPGDRLRDLYLLGMGFAPENDRGNIELFRYADGLRRMEVIKLKLGPGPLMDDPIWDTPLQNGDRLMVRAIPNFHPPREVEIYGEVNYPGPYVIEEGVTRLGDLIELAGGVTDNASLFKARLIRQNVEGEEEEDPELDRIGPIPVVDRDKEDNQYYIMKSREKKGQMVVDFVRLREGDQSQNILLRPKDRVFIPALKRTVIVSGAASFPGEVVYQEGAPVWHYIEQAGGYGWRASEDVVVIKVRTGEKKLAKDVEKIEPGDRIWIKEEPERDYWAIFTQSMGVIGQVSTIVLLYVTLTK